LVGSATTLVPQASYADTSWADLLKPLVKDVIVPGASMGMKKLIERSEKKHSGSASASTTATEQSTTPDVGASASSWVDSAFSTPEEPMSSSADVTPSTPEEPISTASNSVSSAEAPPPPPPVATP
jgi:hypothetical protein